jgi:hypothetical protein
MGLLKLHFKTVTKKFDSSVMASSYSDSDINSDSEIDSDSELFTKITVTLR